MKLRFFLENTRPLIPRSVQLQVSCPSRYIDAGEARLAADERTVETIMLDRRQLLNLRPNSFNSRVINQQPLLEIPLYADLHRRDEMKTPVDIEILLEADIRCVARFAPAQLWEHDLGGFCALSRCEGDALSVVYAP
jgi:hypothetical protein